jgi:hypothetical protein
MTVPNKKEREREIFDLVYGFRWPFEIEDSERPDFIAKLVPLDDPFGIEVTEFFRSESSARLDRIPGYVGDLLQGGAFKHKADRRELTVGKIQIMSGDSVRVSDVPAVIQHVPSVAECAARAAEIIRTKEEALASAFTELRHINLIICDRTGLLGHCTPSEFYGLYCTETLTRAVFGSCFREIYFALRLSVGEVFLPLKMVATLAQLFFFRAALRDPTLDSLAVPDRGVIECFGAYLRAIARGGVFARTGGSNGEVIFGDTGFLLDDDSELQLRMYSDVPIDHYGPVRPITARLDSAAIDAILAFQRKRRFASGLAFRVRTGENAGA